MLYESGSHRGRGCGFGVNERFAGIFFVTRGMHQGSSYVKLQVSVPGLQ